MSALSPKCVTIQDGMFPALSKDHGYDIGGSGGSVPWRHPSHTHHGRLLLKYILMYLNHVFDRFDLDRENITTNVFISVFMVQGKFEVCN